MKPGTNRAPQARALLAEIGDWCVRTGTPETRIGAILFRHAGFVALLRLRLKLTPEKELAVRVFLARHPDGANEVAVPSPYLRRHLKAAKAAADSTCHACGHEPNPHCIYAGCPGRRVA